MNTDHCPICLVLHHMERVPSNVFDRWTQCIRDSESAAETSIVTSLLGELDAHSVAPTTITTTTCLLLKAALTMKTMIGERRFNLFLIRKAQKAKWRYLDDTYNQKQHICTNPRTMYTTSQIQVRVEQAANMVFSSESKLDKQQISSVLLSHIKYLEGGHICFFCEG